MSSENNQRQDIEIAKIKTELKALKDLFADFLTNHFPHLRQKVDWILYLIITTLISIVIKLVFFN